MAEEVKIGVITHYFSKVSVGIINLTDQDYRLDPLTLYNELLRERTFVARLKLFF